MILVVIIPIPLLVIDVSGLVFQVHILVKEIPDLV